MIFISLILIDLFLINCYQYNFRRFIVTVHRLNSNSINNENKNFNISAIREYIRNKLQDDNSTNIKNQLL